MGKHLNGNPAIGPPCERRSAEARERRGHRVPLKKQSPTLWAAPNCHRCFCVVQFVLPGLDASLQIFPWMCSLQLTAASKNRPPRHNAEEI